MIEYSLTTLSSCRCIRTPVNPWVGKRLRLPAAVIALRCASVVSPSANRFKHVFRLLAQSGSGIGETTVHGTPQGARVYVKVVVEES